MDPKFMPTKKLSKEELDKRLRLRQQRHLRRVEKIRAQQKEVKKTGKRIPDAKLAEIQRRRRHERILARINKREELEDAGIILLRDI